MVETVNFELFYFSEFDSKNNCCPLFVEEREKDWMCSVILADLLEIEYVKHKTAKRKNVDK